MDPWRSARASRVPRGRARATSDRARRAGLLAIPAFWAVCLLALPLAIVAGISLSVSVDGSPPYAPLIAAGAAGRLALHLHPENYAALFVDPVFAASLAQSLLLAAAATVLAVGLGLPMACAIAGARPRFRPFLLFAVVLPFWTSFLIRIYAWIGLLRPEGPIAGLLALCGLARGRAQLLDTPGAVLLGMVYAYLPFAVLPMVAVLERQDPALVDAALDLGATPRAAFLLVTLRLARPGVIAGALLVFVPALGEYVIPSLLGGGNTLTVAGLLWTEFFPDGDWPTACALAMVLLVLVIAPIVAIDRLARRALDAPVPRP